MTVAEAIAAFLERAGERGSARDELAASLDLLAGFLAGKKISLLVELTPQVLRDFVSRWYVEEATLPSKSEDRLYSASEITGTGPDRLPEPLSLIMALDAFFSRIDRETGGEAAQELRGVITELRSTMPRAVEIGRALSLHVVERGGAFAFPEFLSSFEEGGQSQYDIDVPGDVGALESYFRITRIDRIRVEAEDVITEDRVWPVLFPEEIARLITPGYIINLEIVRSSQVWLIADCGFTYPPGTEV